MNLYVSIRKTESLADKRQMEFNIENRAVVWEKLK